MEKSETDRFCLFAGQTVSFRKRSFRAGWSGFPTPDSLSAEYHALLLASAPLDWHWVLAIPDSGKNPPAPDAAIPVITGWDPDRPYLWNPEGPSRLLAAWRLDSD